MGTAKRKIFHVPCTAEDCELIQTLLVKHLCEFGKGVECKVSPLFRKFAERQYPDFSNRQILDRMYEKQLNFDQQRATP